MVASLIVEDRHFEYLREQKGSIRDLAPDRAAWHVAYEQKITADYAEINQYLPNSCSSVLDIGGGLGGIDALLVRRFGTDCEVCILDGECDPPMMHLHRRTFNDMRVTEDFLRKNGVERFSFYSPHWLEKPRPFDLIISLGSWCFHYAPETYLEFVRSCCHEGTVLIVDLRRGQTQWLSQMGAAFRLVAHANRQPKFDRLVFHAR